MRKLIGMRAILVSGLVLASISMIPTMGLSTQSFAPGMTPCSQQENVSPDEPAGLYPNSTVDYLLEGSSQQIGDTTTEFGLGTNASASDCIKAAEQYLAYKFPPTPRILPVLERAIALEPNNARAHKDLALAYLQYFGAIAGMQQQLTESQCCRAEAACRAALSLEPNDPETYLLLGQVLNREVNWRYRADDSAIQSIKRAIALSPDWAEAYCDLHIAYGLRNRYKEAVSAFDRESELRAGSQPAGVDDNPGRVEVRKRHEWSDLLSVAEICTKMNDHKRALRYLQRAEILIPGDVVSHCLAGKTFLALSDLESAKREQDALTRICESRDELLVTECEGYRNTLHTAIEASR